jgi:predicted Zn-dependent peptidase
MALLGDHTLHALPGGGQLITAPMPQRTSASVVLMFGVGSRYEDDRIGGVSHFIEHLFFKGTRRRPSAKEVAEAIEGVGGVINASTDKELTMYWARVPSDRLGLAVDVLFDIVGDSQMAPEDVDRERLVILEELKMYQDQPQDYVHSLFEQVMWPSHPLGRDIGGTMESVSKITREELVEYTGGHYRRQNLVTGISGGIEGDAAFELVDRHLALPPEPNGIAYAPAPGPLSDSTVLVHRKDTEQAHICLGTRAISYLDPDRFTLDLVNTVLGEGMSSRLFLEIRERRGLAYDVHSYTSKHHDAGYFAVYMGVDPKKAEGAVECAVAELHRIAEIEISEHELNKAKEFTKGRLRLGLEGTNALASWLCQQQLLTGRIKTVDEVIGLVDAITPADVQRVASRVLTAPIQMAVIGPFASDAGFRNAVGG